MRNIFFVVFLFLPFLSYSQVVSHSFEDSVLTVFIKPQKIEFRTDTIYPSGVPNKIYFIFEDIDSIDSLDAVALIARGNRSIGRSNFINGKASFSTSIIRWEGDRAIVFAKFYKNNILDSLVKEMYIIPPPTLAKMKLPPNERDSVERLEMHIELLNYSRENFEELKEPQENLTEKDRRNIDRIYKKINKSLGNKLSSNKFIDETKIYNIEWLDYLESTERDYLRLLSSLDSSVWRKVYGDSIFDNEDLRYTKYAYFPVIGITYEQAQAFCIWREKVVNDYLNTEQKNKDKNYKITVHYRLPTEEEWEYAAKKYDLNKKSKEKVAEMTSKKGIAKGGSFAHTLEECAADKVQVYDSPQAWLGFRCVAEVVVRKKEDVE